jgi:uncharacterized membrane protein
VIDSETADLVVESVVTVLELIGVAILVVGGVSAVVLAVRAALEGRPVYDAVRRRFGRALLLALEVLVAADVLETVTVDLSLENVASLALLVLVRTVLSISISIEIDGHLPWRRPPRQ